MDEAHSLIVAYDMDKGQAMADTPFAGNDKGDSSQVSYPIFECCFKFCVWLFFTVLYFI